MKHYTYEVRRKLCHWADTYTRHTETYTTHEPLEIGRVYRLPVTPGRAQYRVERLVRVECDQR